MLENKQEESVMQKKKGKNHIQKKRNLLYQN